MTDEEKLKKIVEVNSAFTPSAPINSPDLFAGRQKQIQRLMGTIFQRGQHAVIFGERGVGKTSLATILFDLLVLAGKSGYLVASYNCAAGTDFQAIWRSVFKQLPVTRSPDGPFTLEDEIPENPSPENIRETFMLLDDPSIVIIDEIDRIEQGAATRLADTIKTLSDHSTATTLILVGVADSVDQLISEHQSVERALMQVQMPRMSKPELLEIMDKGLARAEMSIESEPRTEITDLSQGLPHYTHLLSRHSALQAIDHDRLTIQAGDLTAAIKEAVDNQSHSIITAYHNATSSPRENLYRQVLLSCALAQKDELGYFAANDVRPVMQTITGKPYDIPSFSRHLNDFCEISRGPILQKKGQTRRFRFRFVNPLMESFVVMKGIADMLISEGQLDFT